MRNSGAEVLAWFLNDFVQLVVCEQYNVLVQVFLRDRYIAAVRNKRDFYELSHLCCARGEC